MQESRQKQILDFVKPLCAGLDGMTDFGDVERVLLACSEISRGRDDVDADRLFLLAVFSGQKRRVGTFGQASRTELFLRSEGVAGEEVRRLFDSIARFRDDPRTPEEKTVHDAVRLEEVGAYGVSRIVTESARERRDLRELASAIEERAVDDFQTPRGIVLARERIAWMKGFASQLRHEVDAFAAP
jgi:hypothetical protein